MFILFVFSIVLDEFYLYQFSSSCDNGFLQHSYIKKDPSSLFLKGVSAGFSGSFSYYSFIESKYVYDNYNNRVGLRGISRSGNGYFNFQNACIGYGFKGLSFYFNSDNMYRNLSYRKEKYVDEFGNVDSIVERGYDTLYYKYDLVVSYLYKKMGSGFEIGYIDRTKEIYGIAGVSYDDSHLRGGISYYYPFNYVFLHISYRAASFLPVVGSFSVFYKDNEFIPAAGISHYFDAIGTKLSYGVFILNNNAAGNVEIVKELRDRFSFIFDYNIYTYKTEEDDSVYEEYLHTLSMGIDLRW